MTLVSSALARAENRNINVRVVCTSLIFCEFFYAALKTHKKSNPAFLFCAILIFIDLTKKLVGGILKKRMTVCMINSYTRQTVESRL